MTDVSSDPFFSIVVPSLNAGRYLADAIESVLQQDFTDLELIVVDGGSTDETLDVLRRYEHDPRLSWVSEPDRGQSHAINKGWRRSRGRILSWLCADDGLYPGALSVVAREFRDHPTVGLVYGRGDLVDLDGTLLHRTPLGQRDVDTLVHEENFICQPAAFATREAIEAVGFVDESLEYAMDWDLFIRLMRSTEVLHTPEVLAWARSYDTTKSVAGGHRRLREIAKVLHRYTRRRHPPFYLAVAANTYERTARLAADRLPGSLRRVAQERITRVVNVVAPIIERRARMNRGWYPDQWAAPEVAWTFLGRDRVVSVRGRVPEEHPALGDQVITVKADGVVVRREPVGPGDFAFEVELPPMADRAARRVELEARTSFVPKREGINNDRRRLAYYLYELSAHDNLAESGARRG